MTGALAQFLPAARVPQAHGVIVAGAGQAEAVRAEDHAQDGVLVTGTLAQFLPTARLPQAHGTVVVAGGHERTVRTPRHTPNRRRGRGDAGLEVRGRAYGSASFGLVQRSVVE